MPQLPNLKPIDRNELQVGMSVYYRYAMFDLNGPHKIKGFFNDHEGRHVKLADRQLLLADDEDFGALLFYVNP